MKSNWYRLQQEFLDISLPSKFAEFTFLAPNQYRIEHYKGTEVMVVAEDRWTSTLKVEGICLVVDISGKVYTADLLTYALHEYCSASFKQFVMIANQYSDWLSHHDDGENELHTLELQEREFREFVQQIDATALTDEHNFWSVFAEEIGYGFN